MKTEIEAIFHQILKDNMAFWNAVPTSLRLIGISLISTIFCYLGFGFCWSLVSVTLVFLLLGSLGKKKC